MQELISQNHILKWKRDFRNKFSGVTRRKSSDLVIIILGQCSEKRGETLQPENIVPTVK